MLNKILIKLRSRFITSLPDNIRISKLCSSGGYIMFSSAAEKLSFFIMLLLIARNTTPSEFGMITAVFTFAGIFMGVSEAGLGNYFQREAAKGLNLSAELKNALSIKLIFSLLCIISTILYFSSESCSNFLLYPVIALAVSFFALNNFLSKICCGRKMYKPVFYSLITSRILMVTAAVIISTAQCSVNYIITAILLSAVIQSVYLFAELKGAGLNIGFTLDRSTAARMLRSSLPMGMGMLFVWLYDKTDILLIEKFLGPAETGMYAIAYSFYKMPQMISAVLLVPLFTELSAGRLLNRYIIQKVISIYIPVLIIISVVCIFIITALSGCVINAFYGGRYFNVPDILNLLVFALPALMLNNLTGVILNSVYKSRLVMYAAFAGLLINITFNISMLKVWGIKAAVWSTLISEYLVFLLQFIFIINYLAAGRRAVLT